MWANLSTVKADYVCPNSCFVLIHKSNILGILQIPEDAANTDFCVILILIEPLTTNRQLKWDFANQFH